MKFKIAFKKTTISELKKRYQYIADNVDDLKDTIIDDFKKVGLEEIQNSLNSSNFEASEPVNAIERENAIGIQGVQALYDEYGTGTIGKNNPHPEKDSAPIQLNDYNSGKTIRPNKRSTSSASQNGIPLNGLYWTYKFEGKKIYTQGRPAGMHIYKAKNKIKSQMDKIIKKRVGEYISKH